MRHSARGVAANKVVAHVLFATRAGAGGPAATDTVGVDAMRLRPLVLVDAGDDAADILGDIRAVEVDLSRPTTGKCAQASVNLASGEALTLSLAETAKILGIGTSTAYRLCARGEFPVPVLRIGGTVKVSRRRLLDYIDGAGAAGHP